MGGRLPARAIRSALRTGCGRACDGAEVTRCFRHTAARWMHKAGAPRWEVAVQLGHSVGKEYAVTRAVRLLQP
jgi:integrase